MSLLTRRAFNRLAAVAPVFVASGAALAGDADDPWPDLAKEIFNGRPLTETDSIVSLEAPVRAEDAALTPLTLRTAVPAGDTRYVKGITLVIDRNPVPLAASFSLGPKAGVDQIATRVRVNDNSNIHAVAELSDGSLYVTVKFVKAAGGCSAPSLKNQDEAMANLGKMKLRQFPIPLGAENAPREVQLLIRHPNNSGFQMDQVTHYYIPARYVRDIRIWDGDDLVLAVEGGISLSEDPNLRFTFRHTGGQSFKARIVDTQDATFQASWKVEAPGSPGT